MRVKSIGIFETRRSGSLSLSYSTKSMSKRQADEAQTSASEPAAKKTMSATNGSAEAAPAQSTSSFLVQRIKDNAKCPTRGSSHAAGYDLYSYVY